MDQDLSQRKNYCLFGVDFHSNLPPCLQYTVFVCAMGIVLDPKALSVEKVRVKLTEQLDERFLDAHSRLFSILLIVR